MYFKTSWNKNHIFIASVVPVGNGRCYTHCGPFQSTLSNGCTRDLGGNPGLTSETEFKIACAV